VLTRVIRFTTHLHHSVSAAHPHTSNTNSLQSYTMSLAFPEGSTQTAIHASSRGGHRTRYGLITYGRLDYLMPAQEGGIGSDIASLITNRTRTSDHSMQQYSIQMVIGSDAFPQYRGKAPRCATTDQEGVVYRLHPVVAISRLFHTSCDPLLQLLIPVLYAPVLCMTYAL
jgi:hypothetical protein